MKLAGHLRAHWFYVAFGAIASLSVVCCRFASLPPRSAEAAALFALVALPPGLFVACYRDRSNRRQLAVGCIAASCSGLFIAGWAIPESSQYLLPRLAWLKAAELVAIALIEAVILYRLMTLMFRGNPTARQMSEASGAPAWLASLMLLEAGFWKALWHFIRRHAGSTDRNP